MTTPMVNLEPCKLCGSEDLTIVHENGALRGAPKHIEVVDLIPDRVLLTGDYHYVARIMEREYGEGPFNIAMGLSTDLSKEGT